MANIMQPVLKQKNGAVWALVYDKYAKLYMNTPAAFYANSPLESKRIEQTKMNAVLNSLTRTEAIPCWITAKSVELEGRKKKELIPLKWLNRESDKFNSVNLYVEANAVYNACKLLEIKETLDVQFNPIHGYLLLTNPTNKVVKILIHTFRNK